MWWLAEIAARALWSSERLGIAFIGALLAQLIAVVGIVTLVVRVLSKMRRTGIQ